MSGPTTQDPQDRNQDVSEIFGTVDFPLKRHISPHGRVTGVSMMKDEGPFVLEWVAHHLGLGFTDLVVYTNDCTDGTDDMLIRLEQLGLVHHRRNVIAPGKKPQPSALKHAQEDPLVRNSDWVLVFDADEFLCIKYGDGTVDDLIQAVVDTGANGIAVTWRIFGSSGLQEWSAVPVTDQYLSAAPPTWNKGWGVKTLFKFDPDYWRLGIHRPKIKSKHLDTEFPHSVRWLNGSGREMEEYFKFRGWRSIVRTVGYDWAQMNHYAVKSMDSYLIRQLRGNVNNKKDKYNADYWALQDRNETMDYSAMRHAESRRRTLDVLLTDGTLSELHARAISQTESRLAALKDTDTYGEMIARLEVASQVPIALVNATPSKPRNVKKIAAQMSKIESRVTHGSGDMPTRWDRGADPYVTFDMELTEPSSAPVFTNQEIQLPADPRVFNAPALLAIEKGKFERNHARRLPQLMTHEDRYLEIGAGVGFLGAVLSRRFPDMHLTLQEERYPLIVMAARIWKANNIEQSGRRLLLKKALFHPNDGQQVSTGLTELLAHAKATVIYVNDPRMTAEMISSALQASKVPIPEHLIIGARALGGRCDKRDCSDRLFLWGFEPSTEPPLDGALTLVRRGDQT